MCIHTKCFSSEFGKKEKIIDAICETFRLSPNGNAKHNVSWPLHIQAA